MIQKHCGEYLRRLSSDKEGFELRYHKWQCQICGRIFTQKSRVENVEAAQRDHLDMAFQVVQGVMDRVRGVVEVLETTPERDQNINVVEEFKEVLRDMTRLKHNLYGIRKE